MHGKIVAFHEIAVHVFCFLPRGGYLRKCAPHSFFLDLAGVGRSSRRSVSPVCVRAGKTALCSLLPPSRNEPAPLGFVSAKRRCAAPGTRKKRALSRLPLCRVPRCRTRRDGVARPVRGTIRPRGVAGLIVGALHEAPARPGVDPREALAALCRGRRPRRPMRYDGRFTHAPGRIRDMQVPPPGGRGRPPLRRASRRVSNRDPCGMKQVPHKAREPSPTGVGEGLAPPVRGDGETRKKYTANPQKCRDCAAD